MSHARQMLQAYPGSVHVELDALVACIAACYDCAQTCTACGDASRAEPDVAAMLRSITLCEDCSDVCVATGRVMSRQTEFVIELARPVVEACREACRKCAEECERHAHHHEHCRICAEVCRNCEHACNDLLASLRVS